MARARSRRRRRPIPSAPVGRARPLERTGWWARHRRAAVAGGLAVLALAALAAVAIVLNQPPRPDAAALHGAIQAGRAGQEVTFAATVVSEPTNDGGHERMLVRDQLGDTVELDYNVVLGRTVPLHRGDPVVVHGQLYIDPGRAGVHCLHAQTSRGCPEPGWIQFAGTAYS